MLTRGRRYLIHEHHGLAECIILLKLWLQRRALPTPRHGGIPTTVWTCLAVHVFQIATPSTIVEAGRAGVTAAAEAGRNAAVVGVAGDRRPIQNARDFFSRLFGYLADHTGHLYTHRVDINKPLEMDANSLYAISKDRREQRKGLAAGRLWPWAGESYMSGLSTKDPYEERELVPRVSIATWALVWHEVSMG